MVNVMEFLLDDEITKQLTKTQNTNFNVRKLLNNYNLDQSQSIKFGKVFEVFIKKMLTDLGLEIFNNKYVDVIIDGLVYKKDVDVCFIKNCIWYYFECKVNLNLDSEKSKVTDSKIRIITEHFEHGGNIVNGGLLTPWFEKEVGMKISPKTKVYFMSDLFKLLGLTITKDEYYSYLHELGSRINCEI